MPGIPFIQECFIDIGSGWKIRVAANKSCAGSGLFSGPDEILQDRRLLCVGVAASKLTAFVLADTLDALVAHQRACMDRTEGHLRDVVVVIDDVHRISDV